jgi:hypothetical protein
MDGLIEDRIVHYVLTDTDAKEINAAHTAANQTPTASRIPGIQYHAGNSVAAGEHCPAVIVKVWNKENGYVNLKVLLDGEDDYWATSKSYNDGKEPGTWHWIEKA